MKQLSVFLENRAGTMIDALKLLKEAKIQLIGICLADVAEYGLCRVLCDNPDKARDVLNNAGLAVSQSEVLAIEMNDLPGGAYEIVNMFAKENISISYLYSFHYKGMAVLAIKVDDAAKANTVISTKKLRKIEL